MPRLTRIRRLAILFLIVAGCLMVIGGGSPAVMPATKQVTDPQGWTVESLSPTATVNSLTRLTPISVKLLADTVMDVVLRNDYGKDVTAVAACSGLTFYHREYLVSGVEGRQKFASGSTDRFLYSKPRTPGEKLKILAVVFIDGTSEGDQDEIQFMLDMRRGKKIQLLRVLPYFQSLANDFHPSKKTFSATAPAKFAVLKRVAESLPIKTDDGAPLSEGLESGLTHGQAFILKYYVSALDEALSSEKVETWYDFFGEKQTLRYSPDSNFRMKFEEIQTDFNALLNRFRD